MDNFVINGGKKVSGLVKISGSKNAALPILISSILTGEKVTVENVPDLMDIRSTKTLLQYLGKKCEFRRGIFTIEEPGKLKSKAPYNLIRKMRASMLVVGPLLARFGRARVALPGGCSIGVRPVDFHLRAFKDMGAEMCYSGGEEMIRGGAMKGGRVRLAFPSVGATENALMCAVLTKGDTVLENCAREPEISDLAECLRKMGAKIKGDGSKVILIKGVEKLKGARHRVMPDRIETGTFMILAAAAGGNLSLAGGDALHLEAVEKALAMSGVEIKKNGNRVKIIPRRKRPRPVSVRTEPYPGFPTDLQPLWTAYMSVAEGICGIEENIFENRFLYVAELLRLGADIRVRGRKAVVRGVKKLTGAPVMASDIRAGAALAVACAMARGRSVIRRVYHIDRGYESLEKKMRRVGISVFRRKKT